MPQLNYFARWFDIFKRRQREGNEIWFYTAWVPQGKFPNRLIDYPVIKTRILHWMNYHYGATGFLHWGWNRWRGDVMTGSLKSPGDNRIIYPGKRGPLSSLRWEAQRDGIEDAELLWMLEDCLKRLPASSHWDASQRPHELSGWLIRDFTDYSKDTGQLRMVRRSLLNELEVCMSTPKLALYSVRTIKLINRGSSLVRIRGWCNGVRQLKVKGKSVKVRDDGTFEVEVVSHDPWVTIELNTAMRLTALIAQ